MYVRPLRDRLWSAVTGWWLFKPYWVQVALTRPLCWVWGHAEGRSPTWCECCGAELATAWRKVVR